MSSERERHPATTTSKRRVLEHAAESLAAKALKLAHAAVDAADPLSPEHTLALKNACAGAHSSSQAYLALGRSQARDWR